MKKKVPSEAVMGDNDGDRDKQMMAGGNFGAVNEEERYYSPGHKVLRDSPWIVFFDYRFFLDANTAGFAGLSILQVHRPTTIRIPALARGPTLRSGRNGLVKI
jgi:hypothetical protein